MIVSVNAPRAVVEEEPILEEGEEAEGSEGESEGEEDASDNDSGEDSE